MPRITKPIQRNFGATLHNIQYLTFLLRSQHVSVYSTPFSSGDVGLWLNAVLPTCSSFAACIYYMHCKYRDIFTNVFTYNAQWYDPAMSNPNGFLSHNYVNILTRVAH